jgi:hypothetical protein
MYANGTIFLRKNQLFTHPLPIIIVSYLSQLLHGIELEKIKNQMIIDQAG